MVKAGLTILFVALTLAAWAGPVPEPDQNGMCPVPSIPPMSPPALQGIGYHVGLGVEWADFNLNGKRYVIEYDIKRQNENGTVESTPFPVRYFLDANRNGQFDVPGEIWIDTQGNGRCADLELLPSPDPDSKPGSVKPRMS